MFARPVLLRISTISCLLASLLRGGRAVPVWRNLGHEECFNGREQETCGYDQFCSTDKVKMGCRNCTDDDLHLVWCQNDPEEFRRRYPSCAIFCERELWKRNKSELMDLIDEKAAEINHLKKKISITEQDQDEKDKANSVLTQIVIVLGAVVGWCIPTILILLINWRKEKRQRKVQRRQLGTAVLKKTRFCTCFPRKTKSPETADQEEGDISTISAQSHLLENRLPPTAPQQATNETNAAYSGSSDNVTDSGSY